MKPLGKVLLGLGASVMMAAAAFAGAQDKYPLPEPYAGLEKAYLAEYPDLQGVMDAMIVETEQQLAKPANDILHNRICTALVYQMAVKDNLPKADIRLSIAGDLLHNITKADKKSLMTDPEQQKALAADVAKLRAAGYLKNSPEFYTKPEAYSTPALGKNLGLIHHLTGTVRAGVILKEKGFAEKDITLLQACIIEHSTGYWYFRDQVNKILGDKDAWKNVYPDPENQVACYIHDADLVSQFVPASVVPEGSKWRNLAANRWGAEKNNARSEAHVVYYVFQRLFDEARTEQGKVLAKEKWDSISKDLKKLMGLKEEDDPIAVLGVPAFWKD